MDEVTSSVQARMKKVQTYDFIKIIVWLLVNFMKRLTTREIQIEELQKLVFMLVLMSSKKKHYICR